MQQKTINSYNMQLIIRNAGIFAGMNSRWNSSR